MLYFGYDLTPLAKPNGFTLVVGCNLYFKDSSDDTIRCLRCIDGSNLQIQSKVTSCVSENTYCDPAIKYRGLSSVWNALLSCHFCKENSVGTRGFPVLDLEIDKD